MNNFNFSQIPKKYIFAVVAVVVVIIIISVIVLSLQNQAPQFTKLIVTNESELSEVPADLVEGFKETLYADIQRTFQLSSDLNVSDVEVRTDSLSISESHDEITTYAATFLIDIPSLEQTYQVSIYWADGDQNPFSQTVRISCPEDAQLKFPNSQCLIINTNGA